MSPSPLQRILQWLGGHQKATLVGVFLASLGLWAFVQLAGGVTSGNAGTFDQRLLLALRSPLDPTDPLGPPWFEELARDVTALGGMGILVFLTLAVVGYLILRGSRGLALYTLAAVGSGMGMSFLLKAIFQRPRPGLVPHATAVYTSSFPSAHAMASAVVFLTLGGLLARIQPRRRLQGYILLVSVLLTVSVGLSRVYLGVHWPTDVLGGWAAGAAWAAAGWLILDRVQRPPGVGREEEGGAR